MNQWLGARNFFHMGGSLAITAAVLLVAVAALLPPGGRRLARRPAILFGAYCVLYGLAIVFPPRSDQVEWLRVAAYAAILFCLSQVGLLLVTETALGKRLVSAPPRIFVDVVRGLLVCVVGFLTLSVAGIDPGQLLTTSALLTAVVGLALQETLGNLFSGLALELGRPFQVGDWIDLETETARGGRVVEIGWRSTRLVTLDEVEIIIPNAVIARSTIRNFTRPSTLQRRRIPFSAAYAVSPGRVREAVVEAALGVEHVLASPPPHAVLLSFDDSGIGYELRYFTHDYSASELTDSRVRERIWHALGRSGIAFPFPQREVRMLPPDDGEALAAAIAADLADVDLFRGLPAEPLLELARGARIRGWAAAEALFHQGERGDEAFVLRRGRVAVEIDGQIVAELAVGALFGESSLLTGEPRSATVRAQDEVEAAVIGHRALQAVLGHYPELAERLAEVMARRQAENRHRSRTATPVPARESEPPAELLQRIRAFFAR